MDNEQINASVEFETYIDITINKNALTSEVMDNFEKHISNLSDDTDYDNFPTQLEKHIAHIARYVAMGNINHLEGYGDISKIVINQSDNEMHFNSDLELTEVNDGK